MRLGAASFLALAAGFVQAVAASWSHNSLSKQVDLGGAMAMFSLAAEAVPNAKATQYLLYLSLIHI